MFGSNPSIGADSRMSSASPWGRPSMMSMRTTSSASPFCTIRIAEVAPTNPLPTTVTRMSDASRFQLSSQEESYGFRSRRIDLRQRRGEGKKLLDGAGPRGDGDARLLEHQREVVRLGRGDHGVLNGHHVILHQLQQVLVERLHPVEPALGDDVSDLGRTPGIDDPV